MRASAVGLLVLCLVLAAPAGAQYHGSCELETVQVEQLGNAVRLRLVADGLIEVTTQSDQFFTRDEKDNYLPRAQTRMTFSLSNVRSGAASTVPVASYPVSHLEFTMPRGAQENVGLDLTLVLYRPGYLTVFEPLGWDLYNYAMWDESLPGPRVLVERTGGGTELLVTVLLDRPRAPGAKEPDVPPAASRLEVSGTPAQIRLHAVHADLAEVAARLSAVAGSPLYLADDLQATLSAHLEGEHLDRVVRLLARSAGAFLTQEGGAYYLHRMEADSAASFARFGIRSVPLRYLLPQQAQLLLPDLVLPYVRPHSEENALVLSGPAPLLDRIEQDLRTLDQPVYSCGVRAWLISAETETRQVHRALLGWGEGEVDVEADSSGRLQLRLSPETPSRLLARLTARSQDRRLHVQAIPALHVLSGQRAELFVGEQIYYWRQLRAGRASVTLASVPAGSRLEIQPRVAGDLVTARISVESSFPGASSDLGPQVLQRRLEGTVQARSGDTLIIGGLQVAEHSATRSTPPWWPPDSLLSGRIRDQRAGEVWLLVQLRTGLAGELTAPPADEEEI